MADPLMEKQGHTTIFTIKRPELMNALGSNVIADLTADIKEFGADPDQYVAVITGAGEKAFCSGGDLKEMAEDVADGTVLPTSPGPDIGGLSACEKVTIAAVDGLAIAGGVELAISCDIRLASADAWFAIFEVKRGILAGVALSVLPRLMPMGAVMDMVLAGERLSAQDAYRLALVQAVLPSDRLMEAALARAEAMARHSQAAVWG